jgi:hypothetical protein
MPTDAETPEAPAGKIAKSRKSKPALLERRCEECAYWVEDFTEGVEGRTGECRFMPPVVGYDSEHGAWSCSPSTEPDRWCGQFKQKVQ